MTGINFEITSPLVCIQGGNEIFRLNADGTWQGDPQAAVEQIRADARREVIEEIRAEANRIAATSRIVLWWTGPYEYFTTVADWLEGKSDE